MMEMPGQSCPSGEGSRSPRTRPSRPPPPCTGTSSGIKNLEAVQHYHDEAYSMIEAGLSADEQGRVEEARTLYQNGLQTVNKVLAVNCEQISGNDDQKNEAKMLHQKLSKTKLQIEYRLQAIRASEIATPSAPPATTAPQGMELEQPPSYEDATSTIPDSQFVALGDSIMGDATTESASMVANATEIFSIPDGVQIFFITPEGYVSAPSYPSALKIFKFYEEEGEASNTASRPPAFLQVGEWLYPLEPGSSPALQSNYGAYLFPDVAVAVPGAAVGLMIPETVSQAERNLFEDLLGQLTVLQQQEVTPTAPPPEEVSGSQEEGEVTTSSKISKGLIMAAEYLSWGVGKGAEKAGELIKLGSTKLKARLKPEDKPSHIDPRLQTGIQYVRKGSHVAVQVSSFIVSKLGQATMALAREAAPHIRRQGEKILPKSVKQSDGQGKSKLDSVLEVAASGLQGAGTVYMSLEHAAKVLGKNLANETVNVVSHKYGSEAGVFTEHALYATGNIAMTAHNANNLGVKAIAKRAAKDTGKAVLNDLAEQRKVKKETPDRPPPP